MTHALGPLFCDQFVKELPAQLVGQFVTKWDAIRQGSKNQTTKLYADLFLRVADGRLGRQKDRLAATERLKTNPMRSQLPAADGIEAYFDAFRTSVPLPSATILSAPGRPHPDTH